MSENNINATPVEVKAEIVPSNPVKAEAVLPVEAVKTDSAKPWYESMSEEYKTEASKYKTMDDFAKSKKDMRNLLDKKMDSLTDDEFEIYKQRLHKSMGIPSSRDEYNINTIANNREEISRISEDVLENIKETATKHGMTNAQAQAVYDMANSLYIKEEKELSDYFGKNAEAAKQILQERYGKEFDGHMGKVQKYVAQAADMYDIKDIYGVDNGLIMTGDFAKDKPMEMNRSKSDALFFAMCERHSQMVKDKSLGWTERSDAPYATRRRLESFLENNAQALNNNMHPSHSEVNAEYLQLIRENHKNRH